MKTRRKDEIITWRDYKYDGEEYRITVHWYDEEHEHVEAKWRRASDGKTGELGYGLGQCDAVIYEAEQLIKKQRQEEKEAPAPI
jgi:hypothetical protein